MGRPPEKCPMCKEKQKWKHIKPDSKNATFKERVIGIDRCRLPETERVGRTIKVYRCETCGFEHDYRY